MARKCAVRAGLGSAYPPPNDRPDGVDLDVVLAEQVDPQQRLMQRLMSGQQK